MSLGNALKELREAQGQSLQAVADAVGASKAHIWELEAGKSKNPSIELVKKLAAHFEVSVARLVGEERQSKSDVDVAFFRAYDGLTEREKLYLKEMAEGLKELSGNKK